MLCNSVRQQVERIDETKQVNMKNLGGKIGESSDKNMDHSIYIYGMRFPNRVFVGGLTKSCEAKELADFFEKYGTVVEAKIIMDATGISKGYGFITFQTKGDVEHVLTRGQLFFHGKKLNLGPAVRKQAPDSEGEPVVVYQAPSQPPSSFLATSNPQTFLTTSAPSPLTTFLTGCSQPPVPTPHVTPIWFPQPIPFFSQSNMNV